MLGGVPTAMYVGRARCMNGVPGVCAHLFSAWEDVIRKCRECNRARDMPLITDRHSWSSYLKSSVLMRSFARLIL
jgi:hypothetical protein